ncbi:MAG TPA: hypothetical protein VE665_07725, partial [Hyphomicrobiaceae bacterium]|nr:hypothetical protein [Hyphomicrobiaceae bacterium]
MDTLIFLKRCLPALLIAASAPASAQGSTPTPEEYVAHVGGGATIVAAGQLTLDKRRLSCGRRPTVMDGQLDDYGAAYPGFLILNPRLLGKLSTPVKLWIFA